MSDYRPHVRSRHGGPAIKDKSILVGKEDLTPQERADWLRKQTPEVQAEAKEQGRRWELIQIAQANGLLGWEMDVNHYRDGTPYCKCPASGGEQAGTVAAHNARFDAILASVDYGD